MAEYPKAYSSKKITSSKGVVKFRSIYAVIENGKIIKKYGGYHKNKKTADQETQRIIDTLKIKGMKSLVDEDQEMTVGEFAVTHWINDERQQKVVAKNKITRAMNFWKEIGIWDIKICDLTTQMMFKYIRALRDKGYATSTIQHIKTELNTLLRLAVVMGQTDRNVMDGVKNERRTQEEHERQERIFDDVQNKTWSLEEIHENLEKLRHIPKNRVEVTRKTGTHIEMRSSTGSVPEILWYARFLIGFYLGLRSGEILALKHSSFDFESKTVKIERSIGRRETLDPNTLKTKKMEYKETKVKSSSQRIQKCQDEIIDLIKEIAVMQDMLGTYHDDQYIFSDRFGKIVNFDYFRKSWLRIQEICGIENPLPSPKFTRHSSATVLAGLGWSSTDIANHLGHKNDRVTREYYIKQNDPSMRSMADEFSKDHK